MPQNILTAIGIRIDSRKAKQGGKEVENALGGVESRASKVKSVMKGLFVGFSAVQVIRSLGDAITQFSEFNQGMRNVASVSGATAEELKLLSKTAKELAESTRFNPREATEGLYSLASAGQSVRQQIETLPNVLNLAEAAQSSLASATELTVSSMAQFGIEADESQRVVDVFTASIANSSTNVERLSVAMRNSGATANAFNQGFEESVSTVSILTTAFGNGEKAGTGYKALLTSLAKNAGDLGVNVADATGKMRPLGEILDDINAKGRPALEVMETFGDVAGSSLAILLEKGSQGIQEMTDKLVSNGQAAETAAKQLDTLKGDYDQLGSATDLLKIEIGALTESAMRPFIQSITEMVKSIRSNLPEIIALFKGLGVAIAAALGGKILTAAVAGFTLLSGAAREFAVATGIATAAVLAFKTVGKGLLTFFGGWVGLLASAGVGLYTYITAVNDTSEATKTLAERNEELLSSIETIGLTPLANNLVETKIKIADLKSSVAELTAEYEKSQAPQEVILARTKSLRDEIEFNVIARDKLVVKMKEVADARKNTIKEAKASAEAEKIAAKAIKESNDNIDKLIKSLKLEVKQLVDKNIQLKLGKKEYQEYNKQQLLAVATTEDGRKVLSELIDTRNDLSDTYDKSIQDKKDDVTQTEAVTQAYQDYIDKFEPARQALIEQQAEQEKLRLLVDSGKIGWVEYQSRLESVNDEFKQAKTDIKDMNTEASRSKGIFAKFFDELKKGFKQSFDSLKQAFSDDPLGQSATMLDAALKIKDAFENNDSTTRAIFESAQAVAEVIKNPILDAVLAIVGTVDALFGGKLLGTNFEVSGSGFSGGTGASGASGSQYIEEQRQRSFVRGTQTRTTTSSLDNSIMSVLEAIAQSGIAVAQTTATALGINVAELVTGEIAQNFDADGNLVSSIVTVLGRTYQEGIEEFGKRIVAENILAQLSVGAQDVEVTQQQYVDLGGQEFGGNFGIIQDVTVMMNEIEALANRWRDDAELLLEGAQFLLVAQTDLNSGFDLLENGSLTSITDLVEELNLGGETLTDTYVRLAVSAQNLDLALELSNVTLTGTRDEIVRFAADITEAAGGLENATNLWSSYFSNYFTAQEIIVNQLESVNADIAAITSEIGEDINFDNFREKFEEALPNLSPAEVVQWLRLGEYLGVATDLAGQLAQSGLTQALDDYLNLTNDMILANQSLSEQFSNNTTSINGLIDSYDGSIASENEIAAALSSRYSMEMAFIEQIRSASESIDSLINSSIENIRLGQMTDEERYDYLTARAEGLAAGIGDITDPEELERTIAEINRLQSEAYSILDEGQREELAEGFVSFLEEINVQAQQRLDDIELGITNDSDNIVTRLQELLVASQEREDEIQQNFNSSVTQMGVVVDAFDRAAARLDVIDIVVHNDNGSGSYDDVGNL